MFSKACEYGIKATSYIALQSSRNRRVSLNEIAEEIGSPVAFTAKILHLLAKCDILESTTGPRGGFTVAADKLDSVKLKDVVYAIDGNKVYEGCGLGLDKCDANEPCAVHDQYAVIREQLKNMLKNTSLLDVTSDLKTGTTCLKR